MQRSHTVLFVDWKYTSEKLEVVSREWLHSCWAFPGKIYLHVSKYKSFVTKQSDIQTSHPIQYWIWRPTTHIIGMFSFDKRNHQLEKWNILRWLQFGEEGGCASKTSELHHFTLPSSRWVHKSSVSTICSQSKGYQMLYLIYLLIFFKMIGWLIGKIANWDSIFQFLFSCVSFQHYFQ